VSSQGLRGLVVDFYGVLTDGMDGAMRAWSESDNIDYLHFHSAMRDWFGEAGVVTATYNPVHALERGELEIPDFEQKLAEKLQQRDGQPIDADGLVTRMFNRFSHAPDMAGLVRRARASGIATALLSNSWGDQYFRSGWDDMFDVVVISGEVGMRKPDPEIFHYTLAKLGLAAQECVFVDDHPANVSAAVSLGFVGVHHRDYQQTAAELTTLFALPLGS
jgi:epoxide hydrolase-like predicted phosphatase